MIDHRKLVENPGSFIEKDDTFETMQKKCADVRCIDAITYFGITGDKYREAAERVPNTRYGDMLRHAMRAAARTADQLRMAKGN